MRRRLLNLLSLLSLIVFVAAAALTASSFVWFQSALWAKPNERFAIQLSHGRCWVWQETAINGRAPFAGEPYFRCFPLFPARPIDRYRRVETGPHHNWLGFDAWWGVLPGNAVRWREVVFPLWPILLISAILPARQYVRRRAARRAEHRRRMRLCAACGYDLRASDDRCPECGVPVSQEASAA